MDKKCEFLKLNSSYLAIDPAKRSMKFFSVDYILNITCRHCDTEVITQLLMWSTFNNLDTHVVLVVWVKCSLFIM